jgi:excisionase family DNA binding protein
MTKEQSMTQKQSMTRNNEPAILTIREAADLLRVSERAIDRSREQGKLPTMILNGRWKRFRREDLLALLTARDRPDVFGRAVAADQ